MHKRRLCRHVVSVRLSVRLSVTFVAFVETNKRIFKTFSRSGSHTILAFPYQSSWRYSDGDALTGASNTGGIGKNHDSRGISGYRSITGEVRTTTTTVDCAVYRTDRHASVILFIITSMDDHDEEKRTEQSLIVRSGKSEVEITNSLIEDCVRRITLLKWTSDRHEALRGLADSRPTCWDRTWLSPTPMKIKLSSMRLPIRRRRRRGRR